MDRRQTCRRERGEILLLQGSILLILMARLWLMATQPLTDLTEARYGELVRVTCEGGHWLMPHITPTEPFLAKPPLATWLAACSWSWLGHNEFSLRLPSFLASLAAAGMLLAVSSDFGVGRVGRWMMTAMLATSPAWIVSAGSVMTDAVQMAVVTAAMVTAWKAMENPDAVVWRRLFWVSVGMATLSKGLATLALIGLPLAAYVVFGEGLGGLRRSLWDPLGVLLAAGIALAWYVPAELAYPGFLKYFLIGEHFQRFVQPDWSGDRFGHAHRVPWGTIWIFWGAATCFWLPVMPQEIWRRVRSPSPIWTRRSECWLWCWVLAPLAFFTVAHNILWTYTLTAIPPFALIVGRWSDTTFHWGRRVTPAMLLASACVVTALCFVWAPSRFEGRSARELVRIATALSPGKRPCFSGCFRYSGSFYTGGNVRHVETAEELEKAMRESGLLMIVAAPRARHEIELGRARIVAERPTAVLLEVTPPRYASR